MYTHRELGPPKSLNNEDSLSSKITNLPAGQSDLGSSSGEAFSWVTLSCAMSTDKATQLEQFSQDITEDCNEQ